MSSAASPLRHYTFVLKLTDQPGGLELVAATFAHRGISLHTALGNAADLDPEDRAVVLVNFYATPARKESVRRALSRLSRVRSVVEHEQGAPALRKAAMVRLRVGAAVPVFAADESGAVDRVHADPATGETTYALLARPRFVDRLVRELRTRGDLRAVTHTVIAV